MPRAVQIVHAEVASRVRTMIINACAARRAGNTPEEMNQLLRCVALPQCHLPNMHPPLPFCKTQAGARLSVCLVGAVASVFCEDHISIWRQCCCRLAAMLTRFPLPRGSAEGEVIASSIAARCWLSERQVGISSVLHMCCCLWQ